MVINSNDISTEKNKNTDRDRYHMIAIPIFDRNDNANRGSNGNHQTKTK